MSTMKDADKLEQTARSSPIGGPTSAAPGSSSSTSSKKSKGSKANNYGNLEDCYTNVFALTEMNGIKWKCFNTPSNAARGVPLTSDPILKAYSKCLQEGILAAWRRKPQQSNEQDALPLPQFSNDVQKELWVFWFETEPAKIEEYCDGLEMDEELCSSSLMSNTVSYEVLTIMFKAFHVVMERSFMKNGYVRFGRWFTKPLKAYNRNMHNLYPSYTIAVRFNFFVHGGTTVCVVMSAQRQPTLITLHKRHFEPLKKTFAVVLGPWSMRGTLVKDQLNLLNEPKMQANAEREWQDWKAFLQLDIFEKPAKTPKDAENAEKKADETTADEKIDDAEKEIKIEGESTDAEKEKEPEKEAETSQKATTKKKSKNDGKSDGESSSGNSSEEETVEKEAEEEAELPKMILVEIDGVRMLYPTVFIAVTLDDDRFYWESRGHQMQTIPQELCVKGRKPRNRFIVEAGIGTVTLKGPIQHALMNTVKVPVNPPMSGGFAQPYPPIDEKYLRFKFFNEINARCDQARYPGGCTCCVYTRKAIRGPEDTKHERMHFLKKDYNINNHKANLAAYHRLRSAKGNTSNDESDRSRTSSEGTPDKKLFDEKWEGLRKEEEEGKKVNRRRRLVEKKVENEKVMKRKDEGTSEESDNDETVMYDSNQDKSDDAQSSETLEEREEKVQRKKSKNAFMKTLNESDDDWRDDEEDDSWCFDDEEVPDWMETNRESLPTTSMSEDLDKIRVTFEYEYAMTSTPIFSSEDEESRPASPYTPITCLSPKNVEKAKWNEESSPSAVEKTVESAIEKYKLMHENGELKTFDEERSRKFLTEYYSQKNSFKNEKLPKREEKKPKRSREEMIKIIKKIGGKEMTAEEMLRPEESEEALKEYPKLVRYSKENGIYSKEFLGKMRAEEYKKLVEKKEMEKIEHEKLERLEKRKAERTPEIREIEKSVEKAEILKNTKSLAASIKKLAKIRDKAARKEKKKRQKEAKMEECEVIEEKLNILDIKENDKDDFQVPIEVSVGYVSPEYRSTTPMSGVGCLDEKKDPREGFEMERIEEEEGMDVESCSQQNSHQQPDLLSPPASNEMEVKGGPLSVGSDGVLFSRGPLSQEAYVGMNQIYPTPPSVQMAEQPLQSPPKVFRTMPQPPESASIERVKVPGGTATITEILSGDETENLEEWNEKLAKDEKMKKLFSLAKTSRISGFKRKSTVPLSEKFATNGKSECSASRPKKRNGIYPKMVDAAFENPPFESFGKLLVAVKRAKSPQKPMTSVPPQFSQNVGQNNNPNQQILHHLHHPNPQHQGAQFHQNPNYSMNHPMPQYHPQQIGNPMYPPPPQLLGHRGMMPQYPRQPMGPTPMGPPMGMPPMGAHHRPPIPPAYGVPSMPPPHQSPMYPMNTPFGPPGGSVQQLNNFVNQSRFGPPQGGFGPQMAGMPMPYDQQGMMGRMPPMYGMQQQQQQHYQQQQNPGIMHQLLNSHHNQMMMRQPVPHPMYPQQPMHQAQQHAQRQQMMQQFNISNNMVAGNVSISDDNQSSTPEGESVIIAIILSDTILDLHFDQAMDACPICSCTVSIRARELGVYINPHEHLREYDPIKRQKDIGAWSGFSSNNSGSSCTCGFSAIRHRYLSYCSGLFPVDSNEATAIDQSVATVANPVDLNQDGFEVSKNIRWFDPLSASDMAMLDQIRQLAQSHSYGKAIGQLASMEEHAERVSKAMEIGMDIGSASEYVISGVDSTELLLLGNSAIDMCMRSSLSNRKDSGSVHKFLTYFHPWGLQNANEIRDPAASEMKHLFSKIAPSLEESVKLARGAIGSSSASMIEGPMTWRKFVQKGLKNNTMNADDGEDLSSRVEPIPSVMTASPTEPMRSAPQVRSAWNLMNLTPIDQPKDVVYLCVVPDDDVIENKAFKFLENLTTIYEKMKLGKHIPFPVNTKTATTDLLGYGMRKKYMPNELPPIATQSQPKIKRPEPGEEESSWSKFMKFHPNYPEFAPVTPEREGVIRVGGNPNYHPTTCPMNMVASSVEFSNMAKYLNDKTGFVARLQMYLQQMEEVVANVLGDNMEIFERYGFKYQMAIEHRLRREKESTYQGCRDKTVDIGETGTSATPISIDPAATTSTATPTPSSSNFPSLPTASNVQAPLSARPQMPETASPYFGGQQTPFSSAPSTSVRNEVLSPIPAGMVHIPETLPEKERMFQPTLPQLLSEPSSLLPTNASQMNWTQKDTRERNPFVTSSRPPVEFDEIGSKDIDEPSTLPHVIVLYIINPFACSTDQQTVMHMRVALLSFIRTFNGILLRLPPKNRPQLQLEIVGVDQLELNTINYPDFVNDPHSPSDTYSGTCNSNFQGFDERDRCINRYNHKFQSLAVAVYTHPRVLSPECYKSVAPRCMTAFGPGSELLNTIEQLEVMNSDFLFARKCKHLNMPFPTIEQVKQAQMRIAVAPKSLFAYKIPSNLVQLAPQSAVEGKLEGQAQSNEEQVLFVSYCLIGGDYLVATVTDGDGKLIDNCIINMKTRNEPHQTIRFKKRSQILDAMGRLWSFILGVMASDIKNWRLVVGRLGRIGHGEFRAWTHLLNKTSLLKYSTKLKDICEACNQMPGVVGTPSVLSACLVTIEPEANFRIYPDLFDSEMVAANSGSKKRQIHTPEDVSCTHIFTFPVAADINLDSQDQKADTKDEENWEFGDLDIMEGLDAGDTELLKDVGLTETPPSAAFRTGGFQSFFSDEMSIDVQNQPLAQGFYVSTAPAPDLPDWFWAACPSAKRNNPVHLRSSLHIHVSEVKNDDITMEPTTSTKTAEKEPDDEEKEEQIPHPLESHQTEEVLRYVLESYNALSWLNVGPASGDRYSCLPIHIQHLLRLYHSIVRLVM